jgi:hypothetical protein
LAEANVPVPGTHSDWNKGRAFTNFKILDFGEVKKGVRPYASLIENEKAPEALEKLTSVSALFWLQGHY